VLFAAFLEGASGPSDLLVTFFRLALRTSEFLMKGLFSDESDEIAAMFVTGRGLRRNFMMVLAQCGKPPSDSDVELK
jgi:hypothetical protein